MTRSWLLAFLSVLPWQGAQQEPTNPAGKPALSAAQLALEKALAEQKILLDAELELCAIPAAVDIRDDLLEYLLVNPRGNAHESLFTTEVGASQLNVALLALGVQPGTNAVWTPRDPPPTHEEQLAGISSYSVAPPKGDGFLVYVAWKTKNETYFFRVEDLLRNTETGHSMRRHEWVYLGSRSVQSRKDPAQTLFVAELDGNLINLAFFEAGTTLITAALDECLKQTVWLSNAWLLPEQGERVLLIFSRKKLDVLPKRLESALPELAEKPAEVHGR